MVSTFVAHYLLSSFLLITVVAGSITDFTIHRLPNILTVSSSLFGLILQLWLYGLNGLFNGLSGGFSAMILFFPFYIVRWMGAGDVKLLIAVGVYLGWPMALLADAWTLGVGAIVALGLLIWRGGLASYFRRYGSMAKCLIFTGQFAYIPPQPGETATERFPYAFAIALGTVFALFGAKEWEMLGDFFGY